MSTFRPDKRWEQEFKQDTLINLSQWDQKGCTSPSPRLPTRRVNTLSQNWGLHLNSRLPVCLGFWFFFGFSFTPQINRQLHLGSTRADWGAPGPPRIPLGRRLATYSASVANAWGGRQFCKPNCSRPQGRTLAPSGLCHRPSQCVCTCFYFTASSTTL